MTEDAIRRILLEVFDDEAEREATEAIVLKAKGGNIMAYRELMDRKYGKVKEQVENSGETTIRVVYVDGE